MAFPVAWASAVMLLLLLGCTDGAREPSGDAPSRVTVTNAGEVSVSLARERSIEIAPGVSFTSRSVLGAGHPASQELLVEGRLMEMRDDVLWIGTMSYGELGARARVEIRPEGVFVDGERRGLLER